MINLIEFRDAFEVMYYPAGEPHVTMKSGFKYLRSVHGGDRIVAEARDFNDLGIIRTANEILLDNNIRVEWVIPYFPFARHDRRRDRYDGMELDIAVEMLKNVTVLIVDPHSEVTAAFRHVPQAGFVQAWINNSGAKGHELFAIPDAGAAKKAYTWLEANGLESIQCLKKRDTATGKLSGFQVIGDVLDRDVTIVDDICDGGGTFVGLAQELYGNGARNLTLAVTHGLFTKGVEPLAKVFHKIYTMDNYPHEHPQLFKVPLQSVINSGWRI